MVYALNRLRGFDSTRDRSRDKCFAAFLHNNWFGAAVFAGIAANYLADT